MKKLVYVLVVLSIVFNFINVGLNLRLIQLAPGDSSTTDAMISLTILSPTQQIIIHNPLNESYNYSYLDTNNYPIELNVSSNFNPDFWSYKLYDLKHGGVNYTLNVGFPPNTTIETVRFTNYLMVYAENSTTGANATANVTFDINVNKSEPTIGIAQDTFYVCENDIFQVIPFNATDRDEDFVELSLGPGAFPFLAQTSPPANTFNLIINGTLGTAGKTYAFNSIEYFSAEFFVSKSHKGNHTFDLLARDKGIPEDLATKQINITVIEVNNEPNVTLPKGNVRTVWAYGADNRTFSEQVNVSDKEDGREPADFIYNLTFLNGVAPFFGVNSSGWMNFTGSELYLGANNASRVYELSLCVNDTKLSFIHPNITDFCSDDGLSNNVCVDFELVVTAQNRAPWFVNFYPEDLDFTAPGESEIYFNATGYDSDGNNLSFNWYVDGALQQTTSPVIFDEFRFSFPCGVFGEHEVNASVSDGELQSSLTWNVTVDGAVCPVSEAGGGGGGGGGGSSPNQFGCLGIPKPCESFFTETGCTNQLGCTWNGTVCMGVPDACGNFISLTPCNKQEDCSWSNLNCEKKWACYDWLPCDNLQSSLERGSILGQGYRNLGAECLLKSWGTEVCGYQTRKCFDIAFCGSDIFEIISPMPNLIYKNGKISIEAVQSPKVDSLRWTVLGETELYENEFEKEFPEGTHTLIFTAQDVQGKTYSKSVTFTVDGGESRATGDLAEVVVYSKIPGVPYYKPNETQICYYSENPTCGDGLSNCHDGGCEVLVDCGGPCGACATCSDGLQNQGELGIDCGGPCPSICPPETPERSTLLTYLFVLLGVLVLVVLVFILIRFFKLKKEERKVLTVSSHK